MLIKRVNAALFDIFWNKGWDYWARFRREPDGALKFVSGKQMPTQLFQQFRSIVNKRGKKRQMQVSREHYQKIEQQQQEQAAVRVINTMTPL